MHTDHLILVAIVILAFLWNLHRDMRSAAERVAILEGLRDAIAARRGHGSSYERQRPGRGRS